MHDHDIAAMRTALEQDGYVLVRDFFSADEIARQRRIVEDFFASGRGVVFNLGKTQPNAAIECPELSWLFAEPRVTTLFKQLFGNRGAMFTGHCDMHSSIVSSWHRDTGGPGHPYFDDSCFDPECRVYKMAVYLQDHGDGNGLTVHPGSHLRDGKPVGPELSIETKAGDVVVFDVRIHHRGREPNAVEAALTRAGRVGSRLAARVGGRPSESGQPYWTLMAREALDKVTRTPPKLSIFFTFGARNRFSESFARTNMQRQLGQYAAGGSVYPDGLADRLADADVAVYQPQPTGRRAA